MHTAEYWRHSINHIYMEHEHYRHSSVLERIFFIHKIYILLFERNISKKKTFTTSEENRIIVAIPQLCGQCVVHHGSVHKQHRIHFFHSKWRLCSWTASGSNIYLANGNRKKNATDENQIFLSVDCLHCTARYTTYIVRMVHLAHQ